MKINNFFTRALAALVYVALIFTSLFMGSASFGLLCLLFLILCINEYLRLLKKMKIKLDELPPLILSAGSFALVFAYKEFDLPLRYLALIPLSFILIMSKEIFNRVRNPIQNVAYAVLGFVYTFIPISSLYLMGFYNNYSLNDDYSYLFMIAFFLLVWASDTGAYLAGNAFGKRKLFERISPKKTIEGSMGGLVLSMVGAYVVSLFATEISLLDWFVVAILIVVFGIVGDLFESMLKRKADVKDSGSMMPGHGGALDRLDSILFAAPVVFIYLLLIQHG